LRKSTTDGEEAAWWLLRDRSLLGLKFRRQHPLGPYVVDFYCPERRLAIELDGSIHAQPSQARRDKARDKILQSQGIQVLRVPNGMVLEDPDGFVRKILANLPSPVPRRGTPSP
jgi:very-short-patch-repair endonuclease